MQTASLAHTVRSKFAKPGILEKSWLPHQADIVPVENLDAALQALNEAETVIRSQAEHIRHLESLAMTDELTGLLNRRGFTMSLHRELSLARRDPTSDGVLVMIDLDSFKKINDKYGHAAGDSYLQAVGLTLGKFVRASDIVARIGGDEFAILFPRMTEPNGMMRLAKLEKTFNAATMQFGTSILPLRASFGLSIYTGNDTSETVLANADLKLYAHKATRTGRA